MQDLPEAIARRSGRSVSSICFGVVVCIPGFLLVQKGHSLSSLASGAAVAAPKTSAFSNISVSV
jgi:hypothetical protein